MEFALGTVQLGMDYGIANKIGKPDHRSALEILRLATELGFTQIDTARAYGDSENIVGEFLRQSSFSGKVITKLAPIQSASNLEAETKQSIETSLSNLGSRISYFLYHRWKDRQNPAVSKIVDSYSPQLGRLGVSVLDYNEAFQALKDPKMCYIQVPCNLIDHRSRNAEFQALRRARPDVTFAARSALLQGLLTGHAKQLPKIQGFDFKKLEDTLTKLQKDLGRVSRADLCFAYLRGLSWIDVLVLGLDSVEQLKTNAELLKTPPLSSEEILYTDKLTAALGVPEELLSPYLWKMEAH